MEALLSFSVRQGDKLCLDDVQFSYIARRYRRVEGLGDVAHLVLNPAAKIIDRLFRTALADCASCDCRRVLWNRRRPFPEWLKRLLTP
jgi:hypothetical protein